MRTAPVRTDRFRLECQSGGGFHILPFPRVDAIILTTSANFFQRGSVRTRFESENRDAIILLMPTLTPQECVDKWRHATLKEKSAAQEHFIDLCHLIGQATPAEVDSTGESFAFEVGVDKAQGGSGFADVWKKGFFAWEYKGKHADLDKAYQQLLQYRKARMGRLR